MPDKDQDEGTANLIADLMAQPPSFQIEEMLSRVRNYKYHEFHSNGYELAREMLVFHLKQIGLEDLAQLAREGRYAQDAADAAAKMYEKLILRDKR